jgi:hypothetical protein
VQQYAARCHRVAAAAAAVKRLAVADSAGMHFLKKGFIETTHMLPTPTMAWS